MKSIPPRYRNRLLVYRFMDGFNKKEVKDKNILLIDDLSATGTSLLMAQKLLIEQGAKSVTALCIVPTILDFAVPPKRLII